MRAIDEWREDLGALLRRAGPGLVEEGDTVTFWTFAGGRINHTLKYALETLEGWKVIPDNFAVRISGDGVAAGGARRAIDELRRVDFWEDERRRRDMSSRVPEYRLSKFQRALPSRFETEMLGKYLLDFDGTKRWLEASG